jgi:hypothetical protein
MQTYSYPDTLSASQGIHRLLSKAFLGICGFSENKTSNVRTVQGYIEARSRGHCCCGITIRITYSEACSYSCLSHPACKEHEPYYTVVDGLSGSALLTLSQNGTSFGKTVEHKMCVFLSTTFVHL